MKKVFSNFKMLLLVVISLLPFALTSGEGTSQLSAVWYDHNFEQVPLKKILVVGISENKERRRAFETAFVNVIRQGGADAATSLSVLASDQGMRKEAIKEAIKGKGFDAVMASRLVNVDVRAGYVTDTKTEETASSFDSDYQNMYKAVYRPGYLKDAKVVLIQTKIFSSDGKLIWSAESETFDPHSMTDLVALMAKAMGRDLSDKGLIAR